MDSSEISFKIPDLFLPTSNQEGRLSHWFTLHCSFSSSRQTAHLKLSTSFIFASRAVPHKTETINVYIFIRPEFIERLWRSDNHLHFRLHKPPYIVKPRNYQVITDSTGWDVFESLAAKTKFSLFHKKNFADFAENLDLLCRYVKARTLKTDEQSTDISGYYQRQEGYEVIGDMGPHLDSGGQRSGKRKQLPADAGPRAKRHCSDNQGHESKNDQESLEPGVEALKHEILELTTRLDVSKLEVEVLQLKNQVSELTGQAEAWKLRVQVSELTAEAETSKLKAKVLELTTIVSTLTAKSSVQEGKMTECQAQLRELGIWADHEIRILDRAAAEEWVAGQYRNQELQIHHAKIAALEKRCETLEELLPRPGPACLGCNKVIREGELCKWCKAGEF